jgi:hypothetical protein
MANELEHAHQQPSPFKRKLYRLLRLPFVGKSVLEAEERVEQFGFSRKNSQVIEMFCVLLFLGFCSLVVYVIVVAFNFQRVPWSQAVTPALTLGFAMIAYRQWRATRYEISIDKYYDRLEVANKRLEALKLEGAELEDMHAFAELDKLEYVIVKYEYGYIPPILALRALNNFTQLCRDRREFKRKASHWVETASYLDVTRIVVGNVCAECGDPPTAAGKL